MRGIGHASNCRRAKEKAYGAAPPDSDRFVGLTDQQVKTYMERFAVPEMFLNVDGALFVLPFL